MKKLILLLTFCLSFPSLSIAVDDYWSNWTSTTYNPPELALCVSGDTGYKYAARLVGGVTTTSTYTRKEFYRRACPSGARSYRYYFDYDPVCENPIFETDGTGELVAICPPPPEEGCALRFAWVTDPLTNHSDCRNISGELPTCADDLNGPVVDDAFCNGQANPDHSNGTKDGDETGVDCGGSSPAACVKKCPVGYEPASNYPNLTYEYLYGTIHGSTDYSQKPDACLSINHSSTDSSCTDSWMSYGASRSTDILNYGVPVGGTRTYVCGKLAPAYDAAPSSPPALVVDIVYPEGQSSSDYAPSSADGSPSAVDSPSSFTPDDSSIVENCVEKVMSDGSKCTICTSASGGGSVTCIGTDGTLAATKPTTQTPIVDGCNTINYGNGTSCQVCRDSVTGAQTVNCVDGTQAPVDPVTVSPSAVGDGLLGSIDKKMGDVRNQLQGVTPGLNDIGSKINTSNAYLKAIAEKSSASVSMGGVESRLDTTNSKLTSIDTSSKSLLDKFKDATSSEIQNSSNSTSSGVDSGLDASGNNINSAAQGVVDGFDPSSFSPFANVTNRLATLFPSPGVCTALVINWTPTIQTVIPCEPFERFKEIFAWILYIWTSFYIIETLFGSRSSGSRKD